MVVMPLCLYIEQSDSDTDTPGEELVMKWFYGLRPLTEKEI